MKLTISKKQGTTFVLVVLVMMVTSIWLASLTGLTHAGSRNEARRITLMETLASADASLELAWARWRTKASTSSALPTETQLTTGWTDDEKRYTGLNDGVTVLPADVTLRQMDSLGRIMLPDKLAEKNTRTDTSRGLIKRSVSYVATATASGQPIGSSSKTVKMKVNRVFQKSDIPLFQYLAFFDHTLFLHNGPAMTLGGRLHSNKRIFMQSSGTLTVKADMSGPEYNPAVYNADGTKRAHSAILADINTMIANDPDAIRGFFYGTMLPNFNIGNTPNDNAMVLANGARYNPSGEMHLFDPNDTEYQQWWGDSDNDGIENWAESGNSNNNTKGGFRELIEKPVTDSSGNFASGQADTLFIASKRFYNQANIKIEFNSGTSGFATNGVIDPSKINIYYKDLTKVPGNLSPNASAADKLAAIKGHMAKELVPADLKTEIMKALRFNPDKLKDAWIVQEQAYNPLSSGTMDGLMDILDIDMGLLKTALNGWMDGTYGHSSGATSTSPNSSDGVIVYVTDSAASPTTASGKQKGIRIINGAKVPEGGVTVATDMLAYVKGDFNTGGTGTAVQTNTEPTNSDPEDKLPYNTGDSYRPDTHPSALLADNIRLLSSAWNDDTSKTQASSKQRLAAATTFNLAMVMGDFFDNSTETNTGGLHNFPRFLESWNTASSGGSDIKATINGAFIQLWQSKYIRYRYHNQDTCYTPPLRHWNFATGYLKQGPPGSLDAVEYTRGQYWISLAP